MTTVSKVPLSVDDISPSWLQQVLKSDNPGIKITDVVKKPQIEGSYSLLLPLVAMGTKDSEKEQYDLVVKLTRKQEDIPKKVVTLEGREVLFYLKAVPDLHSVNHNHLMPLSVPKCYFPASDTTSMMSVRVLGNLEPQGYTVKPFPEPFTNEGFSLQETVVAVHVLAQIHGLSHRLEHQSGTPLSKKYPWLRDTAKETTTERHLKLFEKGVKEFAEAFPHRPNLARRLEKLTAEVLFTGLNGTVGTPRVLCHGDCWNNNIMFKYNQQGVPEAAMLLDWQHACYRRPTYDLACLLVYTTSRDLRHNHMDDILCQYHQQLQNTLGDTEVTRLRTYTLEDLTTDLQADFICPVARWLMGSFFRPLSHHPQLLHCVEDIRDWGLI